MHNCCYKESYAEAIKLYNDFWQLKHLSRPLIHIKAKKFNSVSLLSLDNVDTRKEKDQSLSWHINFVRQLIFDYELFAEAMPLGVVMFGRDLVAMGKLANVDYEIDEKSEFITFAPDKYFLETPTPTFSQDLPFASFAQKVYKAVIGDIGGRGIINPPTTADALTTICMILGETAFCRACIKQPQLVIKKATELNQLFYDFYDSIYQYLLKMGYGGSGSWFPIFANGRFDSVRSDVSTMFSEAMFRELSLPLIQQACKRLDYSMFNLDSVNLIRFTQQLANIPDLNGFYWNIEPWLYNLEQHLPVMKQLKNLGKVLAIPCRGVEDAKKIINYLGKDGILLELPLANNREEALKIIGEIENLCK